MTSYDKPHFSDRPFIVHIVPDDKFIDVGLERFNAEAPGRNIPIMLAEPHIPRHVKYTDLLFLNIDKALDVIRDARCAAVIFHSISSSFMPLLAQIPEGKKVIWIGWGYDYYDRLLSAAFPGGLLLPKTKEFISRKPKSRLRLIRRAIRRAKMIFKREKKPQPQPEHSIDVLRRVDYFSPVLDIEYEMAVKLNPWFTPKYVCWNYGVTKPGAADQKHMAVNNGHNILVGNSASPENNHIELFDVLRDHVDMDGRKLIVPLSYAGDEWYVQRIIEIGKDYFGDRFLPLTDFIPKDEYSRIQDDCGYIFTNHLRQNAMTNISRMLLKGSKAYINPINPAYRWFLNLGVTLSSIEELSTSAGRQELVPLPPDVQARNIEIISSIIDENVRRERTRNLVRIALGECELTT